jgi:N utilization substance protein A
MGDMVISGAPVSILIDHGLPDNIVEALVSAGIGTVERLGSMTPEELEVIPGISEEVVCQIQSVVVAFYGQYDEEQSEQAPADAEAVEEAIDESGLVSLEGDSLEGDLTEGEPPAAFENIETGLLEHDLATNEPVELEETEEGEVLDLGRVEGLSAAPSTLRGAVQSSETDEDTESGTMKNAD